MITKTTLIRGLAPFTASASHRRFAVRHLLWALAILAATCGGCANPQLVRVKPWQRATLAGYAMRPDRDPLNTAMSEHVYYSRETANGGRGVGGSGCGCN